MSQSIPGKPVFPALPRLSSRGSIHTAMARWTALWERLLGKPHGKASRESHRSLDPREGKHDTAATAREESARASPHSRRGLIPVGRLQKYPKVHVSTGEESSGSGTDSTQGLMPGSSPPVPQMSQSIPGKPVFPALPPLSSRGSTHTTVARGTALWESLVGRPSGKALGKATDPLIHAKGSVTLLLQLGRKAHVHAPHRDEE